MCGMGTAKYGGEGLSVQGRDGERTGEVGGQLCEYDGVGESVRRVTQLPVAMPRHLRQPRCHYLHQLHFSFLSTPPPTIELSVHL